jgi:hypothetical protein
MFWGNDAKSGNDAKRVMMQKVALFASLLSHYLFWEIIILLSSPYLRTLNISFRT